MAVKRLRDRFWVWLYTFAHAQVWGKPDTCGVCGREAHLQVETFTFWQDAGRLCRHCNEQHKMSKGLMYPTHRR